MSIILESREQGLAVNALNDPARRNALSLAMFDALDAALERIGSDDSVHVVVVRGEGPAFCAGFDLGSCVDDPSLLARFIRRLSVLNRSIRRMPQIVIACVHGAAIAGGCAMLSACDLIVIAPDAVLGYPVHAIGISPAVTIPALRMALGDGAARSLLMSGRLLDGVEAHRCGLASHLATADRGSVQDQAMTMARGLTAKGVGALRVTKSWLNELDDSLNDERFDAPADDSARAAAGEETRVMLQAFWSRRQG